MMHHLLVGKIGERHAVQYLNKQGYDILKTNYRTPFGEIDIIGTEEETLVFIEVKTRSSQRYGLPQEAVDQRKQRQLIRSAQYFLMRYTEIDSVCRFDVVAVHLGKLGRAKEIHLIRNAFDTSTE